MLSTVNWGTRDHGGRHVRQHDGRLVQTATPLVSGTVALMKQRDPSITPARVEQILKSTASGRMGSFDP